MVAPRNRNRLLRVRALPGKDVREIDTVTGSPLRDVRVVGKVQGEVIDDGVTLPYHSHYIAKIKDGSLLPLDSETAQLAGVPLPL